MATPSHAQEALEEKYSAAIAIVAAGAMSFAIAPNLTLGPIWLPVTMLVLLEIAALAFHYRQDQDRTKLFGQAASATLTFFMAVSVGLLVTSVIRKTEAPIDLLRSAGALWFTNIIVFASWYWRLDAGGPIERKRPDGLLESSFLFPQMTMAEELKKSTCQDKWQPGFIDYLFLAFNTSTALSPADTAALSRWAKSLMMIQALISLTVIVLLAARAVNML